MVAHLNGRVHAVPFQPKNRLGHPNNYSFSLSNLIFSGSKYPRNVQYSFENRSTERVQWADMWACDTSESVELPAGNITYCNNEDYSSISLRHTFSHWQGHSSARRLFGVEAYHQRLRAGVFAAWRTLTVIGAPMRRAALSTSSAHHIQLQRVAMAELANSSMLRSPPTHSVEVRCLLDLVFSLLLYFVFYFTWVYVQESPVFLHYPRRTLSTCMHW